MIIRSEEIYKKANSIVKSCGTRDTLKIARELGIHLHFLDNLNDLLGMYTYRHKERHILLNSNMEYLIMQMVCGHAFQLSAADWILLDTIDCALIRHHRTVAQIAWFQFFLHPHIEQHCHRCIFGFCYEFLFFVILHRFAEQGFRFAFAFSTRKLPLYLSAAFIFDIKAVVPLFAFLSYRTFCHR